MPATVIHRLPIAKAKSRLGGLARRAHLNKEYFILEKDGVAVAGIIDAEELEDYLELRDPNVRRQIKGSNEDVRAGRTRPASELLAELRRERDLKSANARARRA